MWRCQGGPRGNWGRSPALQMGPRTPAIHAPSFRGETVSPVSSFSNKETHLATHNTETQQHISNTLATPFRGATVLAESQTHAPHTQRETIECLLD
jgi:hypothetical protein